MGARVWDRSGRRRTWVVGTYYVELVSCLIRYEGVLSGWSLFMLGLITYLDVVPWGCG